MNNIYDQTRELELDLTDLFWKLLMQWKAMLIVCILMSLLVSGIKLAKEKAEYKTALADKAKAKKEASLPVEDRIESALDILPSKDRQAVMFVVHLQETAALQQNYLDKSILMNEDPANQRALTVDYLIKSDSDISMKTLIDYYDAGLRNDEFMGSLREIVDPCADPEYIYELVNNKYDDETPEPEYAGSGSAILSVSIVLPEGAEADSVTGLIDSEINRLHSKLEAAVGSHSIQKTSSEDTHVYNSYAVERKTDILDSINTINNSIKNAKSTLSPEQQTAAESIFAIKQNSPIDDDKLGEDIDEIQKPGISKKYALLGFMLGAFLYAGIYVVMLILKKVVASASTAQSYTGLRLLGEIYRKADHEGLRWFLFSDIVARWRYKDKLAVDRQISSLASTLNAVCAHHGTDKLTLMLSGVENGFDDIVGSIVKACSTEGNKKSIALVNADEMDEMAFDSVKNAIYVISSMTKIDGLSQLLSLCKDYDVTALGSIYLEEL